MSDYRFGVSPVNYPDPDPDENISTFFEFDGVLRNGLNRAYCRVSTRLKCQF